MVYMEAKQTTVPAYKMRNPHAVACKKKSKKIAHKGDRRAKDARKSWKNEEHT
jgi:hypothetical protein